MAFTVTVLIPDELAAAIGGAEGLPRKSLEALIVQAYRKGQVTHAEVGGMLQLNRWETDGLLRDAEAFRPHERVEFLSDLEQLRRISKQ